MRQKKKKIFPIQATFESKVKTAPPVTTPVTAPSTPSAPLWRESPLNPCIPHCLKVTLWHGGMDLIMRIGGIHGPDIH